MNILKKIISITFILSAITSTLSHEYDKGSIGINTSTTAISYPVRISVLFSNSNVDILKYIVNDMKKIAQENPNKIQLSFFDAKGKQDEQENQIKQIITEKKTDLILVDMVKMSSTNHFLNLIKNANLPVVFISNADIEAIKSYQRAYYASPSPNEIGVLMGNMLVDEWNKNKINIDKNHNNILEYIMLLGTPNNIYSIATAKYSILTINENNIKTKEIGYKYCNWSEQQAKQTIEQFFLGYGDKIEAIIAIYDTMAIGSIKALQEYGYNISPSKRIVVVGAGGDPEALSLIKKGLMIGTVTFDTYKIASILYTLSFNLLNNRNIIEGTDCTTDPSGKFITIPSLGVKANLD